eukprot:gene8595-17727_t
MIAAERKYVDVVLALLKTSYGRKVNNKERVACTRCPNILESQECLSLMLADFNPFNEGNEQHDVVLQGLHSLSRVMADHIKTHGDLHRNMMTTAAVGISTNENSGKLLKGISLENKPIHSESTFSDDRDVVTSVTASQKGWEALLQVQDMVAELTKYSSSSIAHSFSGDLRSEVDSTVFILSNGKVLYEKPHSISDSGRYYMSLERLTKTLILWREEMKSEMDDEDGNISTEIFYKVRLNQGMEIDVDDGTSTITMCITEGSLLKIVIKGDRQRSEWVEALKLQLNPDTDSMSQCCDGTVVS